MKILVSACLLGENLKYNGKNNFNEVVAKLAESFELVPLCPEVLGGLTIPRLPSEINEDRVVNSAEVDVTYEFLKGANLALEKALKENIKYAILKEKSPSCGVHKIYDGTFSGTLIKGQGIACSLLEKKGIKCYNENEIDKLLEELN